MAATGHEHHDDMIARLKVGDVLTDLLDDTGGLVAERHRHRARAVAVDDREIGMAQARGGDAHQHFTSSRRIEFDLGDAKRLADGIRRRGAHTIEDGGPDLHVRPFCSGRFQRREAGAQFIDQHAVVLGIVDRRRDQMHTAAGEGGLQRGNEAGRYW